MVPPGDLAFFRKDTGSAGVSRLYLYILAAKSLYTIAANDLYIIARELTWNTEGVALRKTSFSTTLDF